MRMMAKLAFLFLTVSMAVLMMPPTIARAASSQVDTLVQAFPTLDELEAHLGIPAASEGANSNPHSKANGPSAGGGYILPVSSRWFTATTASDPFSAWVGPKTGQPEKPLASFLSDIDAAGKQAGALSRQISCFNDNPINKYLLDRFTISASTSYGTNITGIFVNGIGLGTFQQTLLQTYGLTYSLPLLQRYTKSSKWTRVLSGWTISSSIGAMPNLAQTFELRDLLNNLQLTYSVAISYNLNSSTLRKIHDDQYDEEAALAKVNGRAAAAREEMLKAMALRIDALSRNPPVRDTRVSSLRGLYPQFELYQARYEQAASCDDRMEDFFTLKGLALSLLTVAGYDRPDTSGSSLLQTWKKAKFACGSTL
ncbi:MAG: hypothetical protein ACLQVG_12025 [Terriglobia bacterium]